MKLILRTEKSTDFRATKQITDLAFNQEDESILVEKLRKKKEFVPELSIVATSFGEQLGHVLFFPVEIVNKEKTSISLCLGPVSVLPDFQGMGVGSQLIVYGIKKAKELGYESINVLGHPEYYPRFGFKKASDFNIKLPFDVPDEAFMILELKAGVLENLSGEVVYPKEYLDAV